MSALTARIDQATDAGQVTGLKLLYGGADSGDATDNLMARHHGVHAIAPIIVDLVNIGMTNAAEQDVYANILRARIPALERKRR
jgi:hypothetical protein